ncbi:MAG: hypothetical protein ACLRIS_13760 [Flavonifractor plautii]
MDKDLQSIQETRELLRQAKQAQRALAGMSQEQLDKITAYRRSRREHARRWPTWRWRRASAKRG